MSTISSPCTKVCLIDEETGLCEGCGRTRAEIATWGRLSEDERRTIMAGLDRRMRAAFLGESLDEETRGEAG